MAFYAGKREDISPKKKSLSSYIFLGQSRVLPWDLFVIGERRSQIQTEATGQAACGGGIELGSALQLVESRK